MTAYDLLADASAIAELRDLDVLEAFVTDLTSWLPEHGDLGVECRHCHDAFQAHLADVIQRHARVAHPRWLYDRLRALRDDDDED